MYALRAGRLFDGSDGHGPSVVLVDGGRIAGVQPADQPLPDGVELTDLGTDTTLLPGLIDTHVHLVFDAGTEVVDNVQRASDDELMADMRRRSRAALTAGVTTFRDLGDRRFLTLRLRDELADQLDAGPQLLVAGPPITTPRGHCWFLGGEVADADGIRTAVAERAERGVDAVKVMATGGELTPGSFPHQPQFDQAALRLLVEEAHRYGLPVAAHAHGPEGIANALAAGVDTIEHCSFMAEDGVAPDDDLIRDIAASGVIVSSTLGIAPGDHPPPPPRIAAALPKLFELLRAMVAAGITFAVGSDAGIGPPKPHDVLPYGAVALAGMGVDPATALTAVTSVAARACRVADRKGAVRTGHDADLLVVRGDPLADIEALHDVVAVYRAGVRVAGPRTSPPAPPLSALLARLAAAETMPS